MLEVVHSAARRAEAEAEASSSEGLENGEVRLDAAPLLAAFPGPAFLADSAGRVCAANAKAGAVVVALGSGGAASLATAIVATARDRCSRHERLILPAGGGETTIEFTILPLAQTATAADVLVLGRDATIERNFTKALLVSRQLFKDLVTCSSDFAWETDREGRFTFVSPRGALGYSAHELDGRVARSLLDSGDRAGTEPLPFESGQPLDGVELRLVRRDGSTACLEVSSVPVRSETGVWLGCRGVCRDVTEAREREAALARAHDRERLLGTIIDAIRSEIEPAGMLETAARATAKAVDARHCWILRRTWGDGFARAAEHVGAAGPVPDDLEAAVAATLGDEATGGGAPSRSDPLEIETDEMRAIVGLGRYRGEVNGAICLARDRAGPAWSAEERSLVAGVAAHLGIAAAQIVGREALERLSRTDDLTGLLNRRAFTDDVTRQLDHHRRYGRRSALLYVDLDNFKAVNDTHGHHAGDEVLRRVGADLARNIRVGDLAARIGGDEFVLWLAETGIEGGLAKAQSILAGMAWLGERSGAAGQPLGVSIGLAIHDADGGETFEMLLARADRAMYAAKRSGKSAIVLAEGIPPSLAAGAAEAERC